MSLTKAECLVAAARAREYPRGHGYSYIAEPHEVKSAIDAAALLEAYPELEPFG